MKVSTVGEDWQVAKHAEKEVGPHPSEGWRRLVLVPLARRLGQPLAAARIADAEGSTLEAARLAPTLPARCLEDRYYPRHNNYWAAKREIDDPRHLMAERPAHPVGHPRWEECWNVVEDVAPQVPGDIQEREYPAAAVVADMGEQPGRQGPVDILGEG
jgi:hypothetical protein